MNLLSMRIRFSLKTLLMATFAFTSVMALCPMVNAWQFVRHLGSNGDSMALSGDGRLLAHFSLTHQKLVAMDFPSCNIKYKLNIPS
jgi:hypothetical protein